MINMSDKPDIAMRQPKKENDITVFVRVKYEVNLFYLVGKEY